MAVTPVDGEGHDSRNKLIFNNPIKKIIRPIDTNEQDPEGELFADFQRADFPRLRREEDRSADSQVDSLVTSLLGEKYANSLVGNVRREAEKTGLDPIKALEAAKARIEAAILVEKIMSGRVSFVYRNNTITKL